MDNECMTWGKLGINGFTLKTSQEMPALLRQISGLNSLVLQAS